MEESRSLVYHRAVVHRKHTIVVPGTYFIKAMRQRMGK